MKLEKFLIANSLKLD